MTKTEQESFRPRLLALREECGAAIDLERLKALPYTPHCITCARALQERGGGPV
jgi:hypothetical protein